MLVSFDQLKAKLDKKHMLPILLQAQWSSLWQSDIVTTVVPTDISDYGKTIYVQIHKRKKRYCIYRFLWMVKVDTNTYAWEHLYEGEIKTIHTDDEFN